MAPDTMARDHLGPIEAVPPPPPHSFSRYRSLRGKSVSSSHEFEPKRQHEPSLETESKMEGPGHSSSGSPRSRSRSVSNLHHALRSQQRVPSMPALPALPAVPAVPTMPTMPNLPLKVLSPRPINVAAHSGLKMLDTLKAPSSNRQHDQENAPWKPLTIRRPANQESKDSRVAAVADPQPLDQSDTDTNTDTNTDATTDTTDTCDTDDQRQESQHLRQTTPDAQDEAEALQETGVKERPDVVEEKAASVDAKPETQPETHPPPHPQHQQQQQQQQHQPPHQQEQEQEKQERQQQEEQLQPQPQPQLQPQRPQQPQPQPQLQPPRLRLRPLQDDASQKHVADNQGKLVNEVARLEAETDRILAEQKKLDLARLQAQLVTPPPKSKRQLLEKLSLFTKSKRTNTSSSQPSQPSTPSTIVSAIFSPAISHYSRDSSIEDPPTPSVAAAKMSFIEAGGKGAAAHAEAPLSAINGGERRVIVRCNSSTINLPVTAETCPLDILKATADMTRHHITPTKSVVVECYFALGLERRLRRYERIRDVMNSWDRDQQNTLLIMPSDSSHSDRDLDMGSVSRSKEAPSGFSFNLHHSSKPGKWNKKWVTLLENGQIFAAKSANAQPSDKDSTVLCHLTDFDIYAPKESEMRRNLKPPKRFCYAIKSQQKTVVFPNGENFVHFFSTEDAQQALRFYEKVQSWRSWYLVNRMLHHENKNGLPSAAAVAAAVPDTRKGSSSSKKSDKSGATNEKSSGLALREADEPLMNVDDFRISKIILEGEKPKRPLFMEPNAPVHVSNPAGAGAGAGRNDHSVSEMLRAMNKDDAQFSADGLLGDAYERRRQAEMMSSAPMSAADGPFTEAPSLLNGGISKPSGDWEAGEKRGAEPRSWFPSATEHTARTRVQSVTSRAPQLRRPMTADAPSALGMGATGRDRHPAPLLNFAKDFPEPPRFQNGPNPSVRHAAGQPLVNFATGGPAKEQWDGAARRHASRRGAPASSHGPPHPPPQQQPPASVSATAASGAPGTSAGPQRQRSVSTATASQRRPGPNDAQPPPVPPMPLRRPAHGEPSSRPAPRGAPEPLVSRAR